MEQNSEEKKYSDLYNRFHNECREAENDYLNKQGLYAKYWGGHYKINSEEHPDFFKPSRLFESRKKEMDAPILKKAKYKIGEWLLFRKYNLYLLEPADYKLPIDDIKNPTFQHKEEYVLSEGRITEISVTPFGKLLYHFTDLNPKCPECNPNCLEENVLVHQIHRN